MAKPRAATTWLWCVGLATVGACSLDNSADCVEPRTAIDRPGTHHAGFNVRVTDEQGRPVDASVTIGSTATATTDADGYAELRNIASPDWLFLSVRAGNRFRSQYLPLDGVSNGVADLGSLRLKRNVVITGTVKRATEGEQPAAVEEGRVTLYAVGDGEQLAFSPVRDGWFRLEDFDVEPMEIEFDDSRIGTPDIRAPLPIEPGSHRLHFDLTVERDLLRVESRDVPSEPGPAATEEPTHRIELRLVDTEGEPIAGSEVRVSYPARAAPTFTDADGRFSLTAVGVPERLYVTGPWGLVSFGVESPKEEDSRPPDVIADLTGQSEVEIPILRRVELETAGVDAQGLAYSWRSSAGQWRTIDRTQLERMFDDLYTRFPSLLRVDSPGHLPRFAPYPPQGRLVIDFTEDRQLALAVVDEQGPVAGAMVDVVEVATTYLDRVAINEPEADLTVGSLSTDADGRLVRLGNPSALYVAYVYAKGYVPARVILQAGSEKRVLLVKRDVMVTFTGLGVGELLRAKVAGRGSLVALRRVADTSPVVVPLAPGTYDVSVANADSVVERGTTFVLGREPRVVDTSVDRRPELVVRLPELPVVPEGYRSREEKAAGTTPVDRWVAWASRRAPHGRYAFSYLDSRHLQGGKRENLFEVEVREEPGQAASQVLRFSGSGRWVVCLAAERRSLPHRYFVEVELAAGDKRELRMPPLDASLDGTYERHVVANTHGVAGPRIVLVRAAGADTGWNVVNHFPGQALFPYRVADAPERHGFVMPSLPAGDYVIYHHLGEESAWGGVEVSLRGGETTTIPSLGSEPPGMWKVDVVDSEGRPVHDRVLRVRDRMHETWEAFWDIPHSVGIFSTGSGAADPIPLPPARRLRGRPVTFESIRPGWVELVLDDPAGPARHYLRKAEPGSKLTLVVDD